MTLKTMIGLETHVQIKTRSKIFCSCQNPVTATGTAKPNTLTCDTCLGMPGTKPRINKAVVDAALKVALALNCRILPEICFSRKTYFYPDMNKNYQITQYEIPIAEKGIIEISVKGETKKIRINRLHIEEDPARLVHVSGTNPYTRVDYNRAGTPLVEIVTEPDFSAPEDARAYLQKICQVLEYLGIFDFSLEASIKSDANLSIQGGKRVEAKNITGTKEVERALSYELVRQTNVLRGGGSVVQESRAWDPVAGVTKRMRLKETEADYGYIFEPDLTRIELDRKMIEAVKKKLPELPDAKRERLARQYKVSEKAAESLASELAVADLFEKIQKKVGARIAAAWLTGPLKKTLNWNNLRFSTSGVKPEWIEKLLIDFKKGKYTDHVAEQILRKMVQHKEGPDEVARKLGLGKVDAAREIKKIVSEVVKNNRQAVADFKAGEEKALHFLVGQVMRATKGQVDANTAKKFILRKIG